jgi:gamma-glutamyltranspeptidase
MDDFSIPGRVNAYGLKAAKANYIAAGKKPLSSMSPLIVEDAQGRLRMVLGGSGGPRIITAVLQAFIRCSLYPCPRS